MNALWYKVLFSTWVVLTRLAAVLLCGMAVWNLVSPPDQAPDLNVLLLTIDSLRPDHLGCYGYPRETSPNLDRLAREGVRFAQVINQTAWTTPSLVSVLTALYPETHGVDGRDKSTPLGLRTPMRALQRWGYAVPALCYLIALPECSNLGFTSVQEKDLFRWLEQNRHRRFVAEHHLEGVLTVMGTRKEFGPLTRTVWDLLPLYNPFRFRVRETRCGQGRCWSDWLRFRVGEG